MKWLVSDSLSCPEQFFCSHLSSYSHFLREAGEDARSYCMTLDVPGVDYREGDTFARPDVVFALDRYDRCASWHWSLDVATRTPVKRIAQVAAICNPMPWDVRKPDGSPAYDLVISSIPWMVDEARAKGCRAEYMPLAFDTRARVAGMGVKRDLDCIFIGSTGSNHRRRAELLRELSDVVTVLPPVFGREMFKTLARAKVVWNCHAEWARGTANAMRLFEAGGLGCNVVSDGDRPMGMSGPPWWWKFDRDDTASVRAAIESAIHYTSDAGTAEVLVKHTYERRVESIVALARSL